jgi:hypothetical protein
LFRPSADNPVRMSEWFSYNHGSACVYYHCAGYSNVSKAEVCAGTISCAPSISNHDYVIVRIIWPSTSGVDLDIIAGFINTGVAGVQDNTVGFGQGAIVPDNATSVQNSYVYWNDDNQQSGLEAFSVNYSKLLTDYPGITANPLRFRLNAWWYVSRNTGDISVEFYAFSGGYPTVAPAFNMVPGGASVISDYAKIDINLAVTRTPGDNITYANSQTLGYLNYNPVTKTATFTQT